MTAILSVIMIGLGFMNGMIVTAALDKYEMTKLNARLADSFEDQIILERRILRLKEELDNERDEKETLLTKIRTVLFEHTILPPPEGPIQRSDACCNSDSHSDDDDFTCPTSPDVK